MIVIVRGDRAGRLWTARSEQEIRVVDLELIPEHRGTGAGTIVMRRVLAEADRAGLPVRLSVGTNNTRALPFYERLGFEQVGGNEAYFALERLPG